MDILQQYKKAIRERQERLGNDWIVVFREYKIGETFDFEPGDFRVGDRLTLCRGRWARECIYGEAKVKRHISGDKFSLERIA